MSPNEPFDDWPFIDRVHCTRLHASLNGTVTPTDAIKYGEHTGAVHVTAYIMHRLQQLDWCHGRQRECACGVPFTARQSHRLATLIPHHFVTPCQYKLSHNDCTWLALIHCMVAWSGVSCSCRSC